MLSCLGGKRIRRLLLSFLGLFCFQQALLAININNMQIVDEVILADDGYSAEIALHPTDGSLHVAWVSRFFEIKYAVRNYSGGWSVVNTIPIGNLDAYGMEEGSHERKCLGMCIDYRGITHIVFGEKSGDIYYLYGVLGKWSDPVRIVQKGQYSIYLDIVSVWNNLYVIYEDGDQDKIYGVYRIGGSWTGPQFVATGEYPSLRVGSNERVYFLCRGGLYEAGDLHRIKFAVLENGQTSWQFKSGMTNPTGRTGQGPAMDIAGGKIYLSWSNGLDDPDPYIKSRLYLAMADEPGNSWIPRLDEADTDPWDYPYLENTGDPHPNVTVYSSGLVMQMNGGRDERFRLWDGSGWTGFRTAPWNDGVGWDLNKILQVVNDGRTAWIVRSSSGASSREVAVCGITNPGGEIWNPPPPDAVQDLDIITKKVLDTSGFSGDVSVSPVDGSVHVVWVQGSGIRYAVRSAAGTWSSDEEIGTAGHTVYGEQYGWPRPCLAMDVDHSGRCHLVFSTDAGGLYYLSGESGDWGTPVEIDSQSDFIIYPDIESWFNTVSVVYESVSDRTVHSIQASRGQWQASVNLGEGENPVLSQGNEGRLYLCYRSMNLSRDLNFASCIPTFTDWEIQSGMIHPEDQSGASPGMTVVNDEIYIAWNNDTGDEESDYKSQLYCTIGREPGENWLTGQGSYGPVYSESTGDPHTRVSPYSDGHVLLLNGRRLESRFAIYNGETWSMTRTAPWEAGYPLVDTDGHTVWVMVTSNSSTTDEVSLTGIQKPDADPYDFENPAPQMVLNVGTIEAEVGQTLQYDLNLLELGGQTLTVSPSSETPLLQGMSVDNATQVFSWVPQTSDLTADPWGEGPGKHLFGVTLTNTHGKSETVYFWIQVVDENGAPQITSTPVTEVDMGDVYTYTVTATDPEGDAITFEVNGPSGMGINAQTGVITWATDSGDEGAHEVTVTARDVHGDFATQSFTIQVIDQTIPAPGALFSTDITEGIYPLEVTFTDMSTGDINTYAWDFGDFETSSQQNPVHLFEAAGTYTVRLIVSGPGGTDTLTVPDLIHVQEPPPVSGFTVEPDSGSMPLTVQFTDTSQGIIYLWSWDFGDGETSPVRHPEHVYTETGWYTVVLRVTGPGGTDSTVAENLIQVGTTPPIAVFSQDTTWGSPPLTVQFTDQSQGAVTGYSWDFGDGSEKSTMQHPEHVYAEAGVYSVSLKVTGPGGADSVTVEDLIQVGIPKPIAVFSADTTWGEAPLAVQFSDWSQGEVHQYLWDFGDGETSIDSSPAHIYQSEGDFTVRLVVTGPGGSDTLTIDQMIHVDPAVHVAAVQTMPEQFNLHPNTPNPFNPLTQISFDLPQQEQVRITVFDLRGHRIVQLKDAICAAGQHHVLWNGLNENGQSVASGMYVIVMEAGRYRAQRKAIFMK